MQQTTNYQLNQWDPEDRILRTNFNADNAKIDAAIAAIPYVKLADITTTKAAQQVDVDVSGIDFTQFMRIELYWDIPDADGTYYLRLNNISTSSYYLSAVLGSTLAGATRRSHFVRFETKHPQNFRLSDPRRGRALEAWISYNYIKDDYIFCSNLGAMSPVNWEDLVSLNLYNSSGEAVPVGARIALTGVKL